MTHTSKTIVFFGTEDFSLSSLEALVKAGYSIGAVVTKPDTRRGRGNKLSQPLVKSFAKKHGIAVWQPDKLDEIVDNVRQFDSPIGVLVSYGKIIPQRIIDLFSPGIINVHPSVLPIYRGPSPIESAIANRDRKTGVTIMQLIDRMDAGPIYAQVPYALDFTETQPELYDTLAVLGANLLVNTLPGIIDNTLHSTPQNEADASYCHLLSKADSSLDLSNLTPGEAEARIRAHLYYPRSSVMIGKHQIIITKAHAVMTKLTELDIVCKNGAFLSIDELIAPSGKKISSAEFLRGYSPKP